MPNIVISYFNEHFLAFFALLLVRSNLCWKQYLTNDYFLASPDTRRGRSNIRANWPNLFCSIYQRKRSKTETSERVENDHTIFNSTPPPPKPFLKKLKYLARKILQMKTFRVRSFVPNRNWPFLMHSSTSNTISKYFRNFGYVLIYKFIF